MNTTEPTKYKNRVFYADAMAIYEGEVTAAELRTAYLAIEEKSLAHLKKVESPTRRNAIRVSIEIVAEDARPVQLSYSRDANEERHTWFLGWALPYFRRDKRKAKAAG